MTDFKDRFANCAAGIPLEQCKFGVWTEGIIVAALSVGTAIGALAGAPIADRVGRRMAMTIECAVFSVGVIIQVAAFNTWEQVMIGRLVSGLGVGALSIAVPIFNSETAPKAIRGSLVALYQLAITAGILVAACINLGTNQASPSSASWRVPIALGIVFAAILGIGILFMPESPRWLEQHGRSEEAKAAVQKLNGTKDEEQRKAGERLYNEIKQGVYEESKRPKAGWIDCFRPQHKTLYRTLLGMTLQSIQQLTGANYFFYYGASLFTGLGLVNPFIAQIILNGVNFFCTFGGIYIMERFGRRKPLMFGGVWQGIWLLVFASVGTALDPTTNKAAAQVMIISGCLFIAGYATTWAPGVWILVGESFAGRTRAKQGALSTLANWVWNFNLAFFTQPITGDISYSYGYIFAASNIAGAVIVFFFLYESSSLSLEQVDAMYNDSDCTPISSSKWVPEGYSSRNQETADDNDDATLVDGEHPRSDKKKNKMTRKNSPQASVEMRENA